MSLSYAVVTPVRNEIAPLERAGVALGALTHGVLTTQGATNPAIHPARAAAG